MLAYIINSHPQYTKEQTLNLTFSGTLYETQRLGSLSISVLVLEQPCEPNNKMQAHNAIDSPWWVSLKGKHMAALTRMKNMKEYVRI